MRRDQIHECERGTSAAVHHFVAQYRHQVIPAAFAAEGLAHPRHGRPDLFEIRDLAARVFLDALGDLKSAPSGPRFAQWLRRHTVASLRARATDRLPAEPLAPPPKDSTRAEQPLTPFGEIASVQVLIARLPPATRMAIWALAHERLSLSEAAELLGRSPSELLATLRSALRTLRHHAPAPKAQERLRPLSTEAEAALLDTVWSEPTASRRAHAEQALVHDPAAQRRYEALVAERTVLAAAFLRDEVPTTEILRTLRTERPPRRTPRPWLWVAIQSLIAAGIVVGLLLLESQVRLPEIEVTVHMGTARITGASSAAGQTQTPVDKPLVTQARALTDRQAPAVASDRLLVGQTIQSGPQAQVTLTIDGNPVELFPRSALTFHSPEPAYPIVLSLAQGGVWLKFTDADRAFRLDTPIGAVAGHAAEALVYLARESERLEVVVFQGSIAFRGAHENPPAPGNREPIVAGTQDNGTQDNGTQDAAGPAGEHDDDNALPGFDSGPEHTIDVGQGLSFDASGAGVGLVALRPAGFSVGGSSSLRAVSLEYVRRRYRTPQNQLKTRFHWLDLSTYPLSLDAAPADVLEQLEAYEVRRAQAEAPLAALTSRHQRITTELWELVEQWRGTERDLIVLDRRQRQADASAVALRRAERARDMARDALAALTEPGAESPYDPLGVKEFATRAELAVALAERRHQFSLKTEQRVLADTLVRERLKLDRDTVRQQAAQRALAEAEQALAELATKIAALGDPKTALREAEGALENTKVTRDVTRTKSEAAIAAVRALDAKLAALRKRLVRATEHNAQMTAASAEVARQRQALTRARSALDAAHAALAALRTEQQAAQTKLARADATRAEQDAAAAALERLRPKLTQATTTWLALKEPVAEADARRTRASAALDALRATYSGPEADALKAEIERLAAERTDQQKTARRARRALPALERDIQRYRGEIEAAQKALQALQALQAAQPAKEQARTTAQAALDAATQDVTQRRRLLTPVTERLAGIAKKLARAPEIERLRARLEARLQAIRRRSEVVESAIEDAARAEARVAHWRDSASAAVRRAIDAELVKAYDARRTIGATIARYRATRWWLDGMILKEREQLKTKLASLRAALVDQLDWRAAPYRGIALTAAERRTVLRIAVEAYADWRVAAGYRQDPTLARGVFESRYLQRLRQVFGRDARWQAFRRCRPANLEPRVATGAPRDG